MRPRRRAAFRSPAHRATRLAELSRLLGSRREVVKTAQEATLAHGFAEYPTAQECETPARAGASAHRGARI